MTFNATMNELRQLFGFSDDVETISIVDGYLVTTETHKNKYRIEIHRLDGFIQRRGINYGLSTCSKPPRCTVATTLISRFHRGNLDNIEETVREDLRRIDLLPSEDDEA